MTASDGLTNTEEVTVIDYLHGRTKYNISAAYAFKNFQNATSVFGSEEPVLNKYCISVKGKKRYIVPLVLENGNAVRITEIDSEAKQSVEEYKILKRSKYTGFNFDFKPYEN